MVVKARPDFALPIGPTNEGVGLESRFIHFYMRCDTHACRPLATIVSCKRLSAKIGRALALDNGVDAPELLSARGTRSASIIVRKRNRCASWLSTV